MKVLAPGGWVKVTHICRTIPIPVWFLRTTSFELECAGKHLVQCGNVFVRVDLLSPGLLVDTSNGPEPVVSVRKTGRVEELYDLRVEGPSHVYFTSGIASHNSTGIGSSELFKGNVLNDYSSLYLAPMQDHIKTFGDKLMALQRGSVFPPEYILSKGLRNNLYYKEFPRGGNIRLQHVLSDVTKVRGQSSRAVLIDECEVGSTIIAGVSAATVLTDLKIGTAVLAHDDANNIVTDRVKRIVHKGKRHTWTIVTKAGRELTCTGNSRVRTPTGWRYVAEYITDGSDQLCPVASEIKSAQLGSPQYVAGDLAGRLVLLREDGPTAVPQEGAREGHRYAPSDRRIFTLPAPHEAQADPGKLSEDEIVSITHTSIQDVYDVETEKHHTLFAGGIAVHNCQNMNPDHLEEIEMVQKAFRGRKMTVFAGTSLDLDTLLQAQYDSSSGGVWHIPCSCPKRWHSLHDIPDIESMMSVDGLRCPHRGTLLNPQVGEFVHARPRLLAMNRAGFHLPQIIVPEYASGSAFIEIWDNFKNWPRNKWLREVMGIALDTGVSELTKADIEACCCDKTFMQLQKDYFDKTTRYAYVLSGLDWGGSDHQQASNTKQSYTVHTIWGLRGDGIMVLLYACRYAGQHYQDIAGQIVVAHNKFSAYAMGTDNGGGAYYNAYMRDCGRIPTSRIITFNYTETKNVLERIPHPDAHLYSLHRSDSISALIGDIKNRRMVFPRWDDCHGFITDCLNMRRNIVETQTGRSKMQYLRAGAKPDDFMQSMNYATMLKRIIAGESIIPNRQVLSELSTLLGISSVDSHGPLQAYRNMGGHFSA